MNETKTTPTLVSVPQIVSYLDGHGEREFRTQVRQALEALGVDAPIAAWRLEGERLQIDLYNGRMFVFRGVNPPGNKRRAPGRAAPGVPPGEG